MQMHESIKYYRELRGLSQEALAKMVGYSDRSTIAKVEAGQVDLSRSKIIAFAKALRVTPGHILGFETLPDDEPEYPGVTRITSMRQTPLLGRIACGEPILAEENIEDYVDLPKHINADFALECRGDSMIGAGIRDGDVVYIRQQPEVENGQIAAVLVGDDEATLKRFYYDGQTVQLVAENPKFAPMVFTGEDINKVRVIGRAVAFTHSLV